MDLEQYKQLSIRLCCLCRSRDPVEREQGYTELNAHLLEYIQKLARRYDADGQTCQDACQEALLRIMAYLGACRCAETFLAWCCQIVRHELVDCATSLTISLEKEDDEAPAREDTLVSHEPGVEETALDALHYRELIAAIENSPKLNELEKASLLEYYLLGLSDEELAIKYHTSPGNARTCRSRAKAKLRQEYKEW